MSNTTATYEVEAVTRHRDGPPMARVVVSWVTAGRGRFVHASDACEPWLVPAVDELAGVEPGQKLRLVPASEDP